MSYKGEMTGTLRNLLCLWPIILWHYTSVKVNMEVISIFCSFQRAQAGVNISLHVIVLISANLLTSIPHPPSLVACCWRIRMKTRVICAGSVRWERPRARTLSSSRAGVQAACSTFTRTASRSGSAPKSAQVLRASYIFLDLTD